MLEVLDRKILMMAALVVQQACLETVLFFVLLMEEMGVVQRTEAAEEAGAMGAKGLITIMTDIGDLLKMAEVMATQAKDELQELLERVGILCMGAQVEAETVIMDYREPEELVEAEPVVMVAIVEMMV